MGEKTPNFPLFPVLIMFGMFGLVLLGLLMGQPKIPPAKPVTATEIAQAEVIPSATTAPAQVIEAPTEVAQNTVYSAEEVTQGQALFQSICSACHGTDATGIAGLGKNLTASAFVNGLTDEELHQFITIGRPVTDPLNTTGIMMPAKGGNPSLDDHQIDLIIAFIRSRAANIDQVVAAPTVGAPEVYEPYTLPIEGMNFEDVTLPDRTFDAAEAYALSCSGCHGAQGEKTNVGSASALTQTTLSDDQIFDLLTTLHPPLDPATGFSHPVRGDYPALTDDQLHALIDYLHSLPTT